MQERRSVRRSMSVVPLAVVGVGAIVRPTGQTSIQWPRSVRRMLDFGCGRGRPSGRRVRCGQNRFGCPWCRHAQAMLDRFTSSRREAAAAADTMPSGVFLAARALSPSWNNVGAIGREGGEDEAVIERPDPPSSGEGERSLLELAARTGQGFGLDATADFQVHKPRCRLCG